MPIVKITNMLDRVSNFEGRLEAFYADVRDHAAHDGVRLLTYYLARHRRHLPDALGSFGSEQIKRIGKILLKHDNTNFIPQKLFKGRRLPSSVTADELLQAAIELVEDLLTFYQWMLQQPIGHEASALFSALLTIEESHVIELKKMRAMRYF